MLIAKASLKHYDPVGNKVPQTKYLKNFGEYQLPTIHKTS
jgi:hypothetical protein